MIYTYSFYNRVIGPIGTAIMAIVCLGFIYLFYPLLFQSQQRIASGISEDIFLSLLFGSGLTFFTWASVRGSKELYISVDENYLFSRGSLGRHREITWKDAIELKHIPIREPYSGYPGSFYHLYTLVGKDNKGRLTKIEFTSKLIHFEEFFSQVNEMLDKHNIPRVEEVWGAFSRKRVTPPDVSHR